MSAPVRTLRVKCASWDQVEAFYGALRARLERDMRFGRRKKDKFS